MWLDVVTYLHHHGPSDPVEEVPWYRNDEWSYFRGGALPLGAGRRRAAAGAGSRAAGGLVGWLPGLADGEPAVWRAAAERPPSAGWRPPTPAPNASPSTRRPVHHRPRLRHLQQDPPRHRHARGTPPVPAGARGGGGGGGATRRGAAQAAAARAAARRAAPRLPWPRPAVCAAHRPVCDCSAAPPTAPVLCPQIPHYNLCKATEAVKPVMGKYYREPEPSPGPFPTHLWEPLKRSFRCGAAAAAGAAAAGRRRAGGPGRAGPSRRADGCGPPGWWATRHAAPLAPAPTCRLRPPPRVPHRSKDHYVADEGDIVFYQKDKDLKLF